MTNDEHNYIIPLDQRFQQYHGIPLSRIRITFISSVPIYMNTQTFFLSQELPRCRSDLPRRSLNSTNLTS